MSVKKSFFEVINALNWKEHVLSDNDFVKILTKAEFAHARYLADEITSFVINHQAKILVNYDDEIALLGNELEKIQQNFDDFRQELIGLGIINVPTDDLSLYGKVILRLRNLALAKGRPISA